MSDPEVTRENKCGCQAGEYIGNKLASLEYTFSKTLHTSTFFVVPPRVKKVQGFSLTVITGRDFDTVQ